MSNSESFLYLVGTKHYKKWCQKNEEMGKMQS